MMSDSTIKICANCRWLGALGENELVCGRFYDFKKTKLYNTCEHFELDDIYIRPKQQEKLFIYITTEGANGDLAIQKEGENE